MAKDSEAKPSEAATISEAPAAVPEKLTPLEAKRKAVVESLNELTLAELDSVSQSVRNQINSRRPLV